MYTANFFGLDQSRTRSVSDCIQSDTHHYYISVSDHSVTRFVSDCKYCSDTGSKLSVPELYTEHLQL